MTVVQQQTLQQFREAVAGIGDPAACDFRRALIEGSAYGRHGYGGINKWINVIPGDLPAFGEPLFRSADQWRWIDRH